MLENSVPYCSFDLSEGGLQVDPSISFVLLTGFTLQFFLSLNNQGTEPIRPPKAADELLGRQDGAFRKGYDLPTYRVPVPVCANPPATKLFPVASGKRAIFAIFWLLLSRLNCGEGLHGNWAVRR